MATARLTSEQQANLREDRAIYRAIKILDRRFRVPGPAATSSKIAESLLRLELSSEDREHFVVLFLDARHCLVARERLFSGTVDGAAVYPRVIVQRALFHNAAAVILGHNHPSGIPAPSGADKVITMRVREALSLVDVRLLDHLVVSLGGAFSFAADGLAWILDGSQPPVDKPAKRIRNQRKAAL